MQVDLTPEEMRYILETIGAGDSTKPVVSSILTKMTAACRNFSQNDVVPPEAGPDPRDMAHKWKSPI